MPEIRWLRAIRAARIACTPAVPAGTICPIAAVQRPVGRVKPFLNPALKPPIRASRVQTPRTRTRVAPCVQRPPVPAAVDTYARRTRNTPVVTPGTTHRRAA